ncbi:hypothetical protein SORBI_3009G132400 [Sorghum bicolor]|uniref:Uncharacterized protein n=3 Tax=Sorghum bicolor TaxID=4558 RepID=A0A1Z5R2F8_SORBI|nr:hypothetical protein SORBI_3009G132400 [Sorghum bicolor]
MNQSLVVQLEMDRMERTERFVQLKKLAGSVISYWSIVSVSVEEKLNFMPLLLYAKSESVDEIPEHIAVSQDFLETAENESIRLEKIVAEMIVRKKSKLDQIYQRSHLESPFAGQGPSDTSVAFELVKEQITIAKAVSMKRQDIVTRMEMLDNACHEIQWYLNANSDVHSVEDHHRVARGKMLFDFFPKMMEDLEAKVIIWNLKEDENFSFDGVDIREKIEGLKVFYEDTVRENPEAGGVVHEAPKAGGVDIDMVPVGLEAGGVAHEDPEAGGVVHEAPKAGGVDIDMVPVGLEAGGIDIFQQLVIPRQPRTPRIPVQVNVQPPPLRRHHHHRSHQTVMTLWHPVGVNPILRTWTMTRTALMHLMSDA